MAKKLNNFHSDKAGNWIGVGVAIGAVIFALTNEPVWIALVLLWVLRVTLVFRGKKIKIDSSKLG